MLWWDLLGLKSNDLKKKTQAIERLGSSKNARAVAPLIAALRGTTHGIRKSIVMALGKLADPQAIGALESLLVDRHSEVREAAAQTLLQFGWQPKSDVQLVQFSVAIRDWARLVSLGNISIERLSAVLHEADLEVRQGAVKSLREIGGQQVAKPLINSLSDPHQVVQREALIALCDLGDPDRLGTKKPIISYFQKNPGFLIEAILEAVGKLKGSWIEDLLFNISQEVEDKRFCGKVVATLASIDSPNTVDRLIHFLKPDQDNIIRAAAMDALVKSLDPTITDFLIHFVQQDDDVTVRGKAMDALAKRLDPTVTDFLIHFVQQDDDVTVRGKAMDALANLVDPRIMALAIFLIKQERDGVILHPAIEALGKQGDPRAIELLIPFLDDNDKYEDVGNYHIGYEHYSLVYAGLWTTAAIALCKLGSDRAVEKLVSILSWDDDRYSLMVKGRAKSVIKMLDISQAKLHLEYIVRRNVAGELRLRQAASEALRIIDGEK